MSVLWAPLLLLLLLLDGESIASAKPAGKAKSAQRPAPPEKQQEWFFYNDVTGDRQWEDPGGVPYEDDAGLPYWLGPGGERLAEDPHAPAFAWLQQWSEDSQRPFYWNQETKETTWVKPADLAWRRVRVQR